MDCREFEIYVDAYVEGTLDSDRSGAMDEHIASCQSCSEVVKALRSVMSSLDTTIEIKAPEDFAARVRARIEAEQSARIIPFPAHSAEINAAVTCETFGERVAAFVDGSLDEVRKKQMAGHRESCAACDRLARSHEHVLAALTTAEPVSAPQGFAARVRTAVATETATGTVKVTSTLRKMDILVAACVSIMVLTGLILLFLPGHMSFPEESAGLAGYTETVITRLTVTPLLFKAWVATTIPAEYWILISRLTEPQDIPYLPIRFSLLFYLSAAFTAVTTWLIARKFSAPKMSFSPYLR